MTSIASTTSFPLKSEPLAAAGLRTEQLERLYALIEKQIAEGRYPGCQIALARHGKLLLDKTFGQARLAPGAKKADDATLWLLFSNTKVIVATALWKLFEEGAFRFTDKLSAHVPEFSRNGKGDITILQVITHQGGFPTAGVGPDAWADHAVLKKKVCDFSLSWTPGSRVAYHPLAAHWALAVLIETLTGQDYRQYIRSAVLEPLGLSREIFVGLPENEEARAADMYEPSPDGRSMNPLTDSNSAEWRRAGAPGGGGYGTARGMVALYQMMLAGGELNGVRLLSPRTLNYAIRNYTGDRVDEFMGIPMHRGLGPHLRGTTAIMRGLGSIAPASTFGHGGVGSSYCWGDPDSGVSFAYLTNNRALDPWHSDRLDTVSNLVHSAIV